MDEIGSSASDAVELGDLFRAIYRAKWLLMLFLLVALGGAYAYLQVTLPRYEATALILIEKHRDAFTRPQVEGSNGYQTSNMSELDVRSQLQVLLSKDISEDVAKELKLEDVPEYNPSLRAESELDKLKKKLRLSSETSLPLNEQILEKLEKSRHFAAVANTRVLSVGFESTNPELAAKLANGYAQAYMRRQTERQNDQLSGTDAWLGQQTEELRKQAEAAENELQKFRQESGIVLSRNSETLTVQQISELSTQLTMARTEYAEVKARAELAQRMLKGGGTLSKADQTDGKYLQDLNQQKILLKQRISQLQTTYQSSHPSLLQAKAELKGIEAELVAANKRLVMQLEAEAEIAKKRVASLEKDLSKVKALSDDKSAAQAKLSILEREAESKRDLYENYVSRRSESNIRRTTGPSTIDAEIIQEARPSHSAVFPNKSLVLIVVAIASLFFGIAIVLSKELISPASRKVKPEKPVKDNVAKLVTADGAEVSEGGKD